MPTRVYLNQDTDPQDFCNVNNPAVMLYKEPIGLLQGTDTGLLTVSHSESDTKNVGGLLLTRKQYTPEEMDTFRQKANEFAFRHQFTFSMWSPASEGGSRSGDKIQKIIPQLQECVIADGELWGFYYYMSQLGRVDSAYGGIPDYRLEGVLALSGNVYGYSEFHIHDADSFSDPSYYDDEIHIRISLDKTE